MFILAFLCCIAVLISTIIIFRNELSNIWLFVVCGILITLTVIMGSLFLTKIISKKVNVRLSDMMNEVTKASDNIRQENERLMLMLDTSPICTQIWDKNLNTIDCNEAAVRLYNFKDKQEYIDNFVRLCSPEFQPNGRRSDEFAVELVNKAFKEGYISFDWMHQIPADGTLIPAEVILVLGKYHNDDVVLGYTRDLREHNKMMRAVEAAHFTTSAMFESNPHINILFDGDFNIIDCNPAALDFFGFKTKQEMVDGFFDQIQENLPVMRYSKYDSIISLREEFEIAVNDGTGKFEIVVVLNRELKSLNVELIKIPYLGSFAIVAYIFDMTEITGLQDKLLRETATLQAIFDSIPDMVFCKNTELKYTRCNKSLLEFFNLKEEDIIGKDDVEGLGVPLEFAEDFTMVDRTVINEKRIVSREEHIPAPDGSTRLVETSKVPLLYNNEIIGILGIARDITDRKAMEEAAQSANRSKTQFLANMSHEIRTPMNSIIGFSELAREGDIPDETKKYLGNIQDSAEWLLRILNDILDISKIESGRIEFEYIPFDFTDIFESCRSAIMPAFNDKGIELYCYAEPSFGKKLLGDPVRLRQVIMNLLSNAIKFTETGTVKVMASILNSNENTVTIQIQVKDSGIGMTPEQIDKVLKPYMQADDSITRRFGGTGLGLTITRNIIKLMGGTLSVESIPGIGSCFSFELTFDLIDEADIQTEETMINEDERPCFIGEILICEDNDLNQQVICEHLTRVGLKTVVAKNGKEGVDIVAKRLKTRKKQFDLIFMDIHMPVMDGLDAASRITALGVKTPIVALTANVMTNDLELYRISGMYDTLSKPFTSLGLWKCLARYLPVEGYSKIDKRHRKEEEAKSLELIKTNFVKSNQNTYRDIIIAIDNDDIKLAHRLVHSLKSNAGQIGEARLQSVAMETEKVLLSEENHLDDKLKHELETELKLVLDKLEPLRHKQKTIKTPETVEVDKILELFDKLEPLLKNSDTECMKLLDELYAVPGTGELVKQIEDYEYKRALASLKRIKKKLI